jgi:hypothetical protein
MNELEREERTKHQPLTKQSTAQLTSEVKANKVQFEVQT